jgi:putative transcriptional regulator
LIASLQNLIQMAKSEPGLQLLVDTAAAVRGEPSFVAEARDMVGGILLDDELPVALAQTALSDTLARIDHLDQLDTKAREAAASAGAGLNEILALPEPLRKAALEALETESWRFAGLGVRRLPMSLGGKAHVELLRINPGASVPRHDHDGDEVTLVLTGAFHDGHHHFGPGEISIAGEGLVHQPVADAGAVCYALAVSYGELRFQGALGVLQRALRLN